MPLPLALAMTMTKAMRILEAVLRRFLLLLVALYRYGLSPLLPPRCRFLPSCSEYAQEALIRHGALYGSFLTLRRLSRCHPWGGSGFDPVPERFPASGRDLLSGAGSAPYLHLARSSPRPEGGSASRSCCDARSGIKEAGGAVRSQRHE
jgi:uncharacterized protein